MRVLVSGGAGYIGSHTVRALIKEKHQPVVVDNLICGNEKVIKKSDTSTAADRDIKQKSQTHTTNNTNNHSHKNTV